MSQKHESFEEMQRRVTGQAPTLGSQLREIIKRNSWPKILIPAAFLAFFAYSLSSDLLEDQALPGYVFYALAAVVFVVVIVLLTAREISSPQGEERPRRTKQ
ncbi:MAG: hypothetical protein ACR2QV_01475 [Gammaproteobacteria bacterium]